MTRSGNVMEKVTEWSLTKEQEVGQKSSVPKRVKVTRFVVTRKWKSRNPDLCLRLIDIIDSFFNDTSTWRIK